MLTNRQYAFARTGDGDAVIVVVNNDEQEAGVSVRVPDASVSYQDAVTGEAAESVNGQIQVKLPANGCRIIVKEL